MNKSELVAHIAEEAELTKADSARALEAVITGVTKALKDGDAVSIVGFGSFGLTRRKASKGRNPRTGEEIEIAASNVVRFKAGKQLKENVN